MGQREKGNLFMRVLLFFRIPVLNICLQLLLSYLKISKSTDQQLLQNICSNNDRKFSISCYTTIQIKLIKVWNKANNITTECYDLC